MRVDPLWFVSPAVLFTEVLSRTLRFTQEGLEEGELVRKAGPLVVPFWHDELFPLIHLHRNQGVVAVVSQSRDGEFLSQVMAKFGFQLARGSSRRGGVAALIAARREMRSRNADVVVTVDGPKGPRHKVKEGAVYLASKADAPLVPLRVYMSRSFIFQKSWDKFQLPWPGARCRVVYGKPYRIPPVMSAEETAAECLRLEAMLNTLGS